VNAVAPGIPRPKRAAGRRLGRLSREYQDVVDGTVALLQRYRKECQAQAQVAQLTAELWSEWQALWSDAAECLAEIGSEPNSLAAAKEYTQVQLTPELVCGPLWQQAHSKPQGYPGDYMVMDYIYDGRPRGDSPFACVAHALGINIGQFVVKRKDLVRETIAEVVARRQEPGTVSIVSLGAGPAREVVDLARSNRTGARPVTFVLVDQDGDALRFAGHAVSSALASYEAGSQIRVEPRQVSVLRLLREIDPCSFVPGADMIYSAGLFDYFSNRTCRMLTRRLYEALRPGGTLLLGNMKAGTDMVWPLDLIADWSLNYRTGENILSWADGLKGAEISLRTEATGYDYLLGVRKPA
jgi:extracellular factor (EF) 3-hydroxypalmitic acid methyl ester biosynthesis protein